MECVGRTPVTSARFLVTDRRYKDRTRTCPFSVQQMKRCYVPMYPSLDTSQKGDSGPAGFSCVPEKHLHCKRLWHALLDSHNAFLRRFDNVVRRLRRTIDHANRPYRALWHTFSEKLRCRGVARIEVNNILIVVKESCQMLLE